MKKSYAKPIIHHLLLADSCPATLKIKCPPPTPLSSTPVFVVECDVIWHEITLWPVQVVCLSSCPPPAHSAGRQSKK